MIKQRKYKYTKKYQLHSDIKVKKNKHRYCLIKKSTKNKKSKNTIRKQWMAWNPSDHRINLKESEKKDKYLDLARELKKLWNMKVTIVPIVIGALGTVTIGLLKGLEDLEVSGRVETIQTTAFLRTARILRRVLETWGDFLSLKLQWKPLANTDVKNSRGVNNNNGSPYLDQTTRPYNNQQKKKMRTRRIVDFIVLADHWVKLKESKKKDKYLDLAQELKKNVEHENDDYINCNRFSWYSQLKIDTRTRGLGNNRTSGDHPNYFIIEIRQNTKRSPGDLRRLLSLKLRRKTTG